MLRTRIAVAVLIVCGAIAVIVPMYTCPPGWRLGTSWWFGRSWASCGRRFPTQDVGIPAVSQLGLKVTVGVMGSLLAAAIAFLRPGRDRPPTSPPGLVMRRHGN
jgi:hypothetical protein